jgi:hypothetical protein
LYTQDQVVLIRRMRTQTVNTIWMIHDNAIPGSD